MRFHIETDETDKNHRISNGKNQLTKRGEPVRFVTNAFSLLAILGLALTVWAQPAYQNHMLVKVLPESKERLTELHRYSNLDLVGGETSMEPYLVALPEDLTFLQFHGYRYEVMQQNLERYYANRLTSGPGALMGGYKTYAEIATEMDNIHTAHPNITTAKFSIGNTLEGRAMWVMKISDNPDVDEDEPEVFYNSLIHAREPEGMETLFYFMNWLTDNYGTNSEATFLVENREMFFLPCLNVDGYEYNRSTNPSGGGMWRKNRRPNAGGSYGVDLNRNFDAAWGIDDVGSSPTPSDDTYRGTAAFSEPETQNIRAFVNTRHFVTEEDCHTYQDLLLIPWGTSYYPPPSGTGVTPDDATYRMIIDSMAYYIHSVNGVWYTEGTPWETLYNTNGGSFDWEYEDQAEHAKIFAMTTEIGNSSDGFWPPTNRILPLAQENLPAFAFLARIAGTLAPRPYQITYNGQCQNEVGGNSNGATDPGETLSLTVNVKNTGMNTLNALSGTISTADPYATIGISTSTWPVLTNGQSSNNSTPFQVTISPTCPTPHYIMLSLHLIQAGNLDTTLAISAAVGRTSLVDNVEGGVAGWTTGGTNNQWHISTRRASSQTHAWFSGTDAGNYADNMSAYLLSQQLILGPGAEISYDQYYSLESNYDYGYFEANYGAGWVQLGTRITGSSGAWVNVVQPLNITCVGTMVQLRFRMTSDQNTNAEGWYIDNISTGCAGVADIAANPASVIGIAPLNGTDSRALQICNQGACPLTWGIVFNQLTPPVPFLTLTVPEIQPENSVSELSADKGNESDRHNPDPLDNSGGPDAFGYRWKDSNDPGGPIYNWIELAGLGTNLGFNADDQVIAVNLPWSFPFYGTGYTQARVSTNGNIHFGTDSSDWRNLPVPDRRRPNAMICPFSDDLSPQQTGAAIYSYNDDANNRFIIQWDSVPHYAGVNNGRYTFEVILYSTGRMVFQYQNLVGDLNSCSVGIENTDGTVGLQVTYNANYLTNGLAIAFSTNAPWLAFGSPVSGSLDPTQCTNITLNFTAGSLPIGSYTGNLVITNNDPDENPTTVPVIFQVGQLNPPEQFVISCDAVSSQLIFNWQTTGAPAYKVYSATAPEGPFSALVGQTTTTSLAVPLPANDVLFYVVVSTDGHLDSGPSSLGAVK